MMLYIHIPFCIKKCSYCDFLSYPNSEDFFEKYIDTLCIELALRKTPVKLSSIYIGGGTPSILPLSLIEKLFICIIDNFTLEENAEITFECNPATLSKDKCAYIYKNTPINRISIGLQSAKDNELKALGRIHTFRDFLISYDYLSNAGFGNLNIDIMTGIPGQTKDSLSYTLNEILKLSPAHISTYALILEENTPFYKAYDEGRLDLPPEDLEFDLYKQAIQTLTDRGYERYEISNFAKGGLYSRHNLGYWDRLDYIGCGLGAASLLDHKRYKNISDINRYISLSNLNELFEEEISLSMEDEISEFMFLGLRKIHGIMIKDFIKAFNNSPEAYYKNQLDALKKEGLLKNNQDRIYLSDKGIDFSNRVLAEFLL